MHEHNSRTLRFIFWAVLFFVVNVLSAAAVLRIFSLNSVVAVFWPPSGLAVAAVLLGGRRFLPVIFAACYAANWYATGSFGNSAIFALANTLEAALAYWLLHRVYPIDKAISTSRDFLRLVIFGALIAPLPAALLGALTLHLSGEFAQPFLANFSSWWMGDSLGVIVVGSLVLIWQKLPAWHNAKLLWIESVLMIATTLLVGHVVFLDLISNIFSGHAQAFVIFLPIVWSAVRLGRHATTIAIVVMLAEIIFGLINKHVYFHADNQLSLGFIWLFIASVAMIGMALATLVHERGLMFENLAKVHARLENAMTLARVGGWEFNPHTKSIEFSRETLRILDVPPDYPLSHAEVREFVAPEERPIHYARFQLALDEGIDWDTEVEMRTHKGRTIWVHSQGKCITLPSGERRVFGAIHDITEKRKTLEALRKSELDFRQLVETASEGVWTIDVEGSTQFVNARMAEILGYTAAEMTGKSYLTFIPPEGREQAIQKLLQRKKAEREIAEGRLLHKSGERIWAIISTSPIFNERGEFIGALAMVNDISTRKRIEDDLRSSETRYRHLIESSSEAMIVHQKGKLVFANKAALQLIRADDAARILGKSIIDFVAPEYRDLVVQRQQALTNPSDTAPLIEEKFLRLDGTIVDVEVAATATIFNGEIAAMVVARDISARKQTETQIRYLGQHDVLTGLPNRALFADRIAHAIKFSETHAKKFALLYLDLDHFKKVNDTHGHRHGDVYLCQVAERLKTCVRSTDTVSRQGGDEFSVLISEIAHADDAAKIARTICDALNQPFFIDDTQIVASASVGIAIFPDDGADADTLLRSADMAMYHAKHEGRNQYQFFSEELNRVLRQRLETEAALRRAVEKNEFSILYQPQVNMQTGGIETCEALVRWRHPERGELEPADFIPIAEESGQIGAIGALVLSQVFDDMPRFDAQDFKDLRFAINVSALQLQHETFADALEKLMREKLIDPRRIELEVTESMLMADVERVSRTIQRLTKHGITFAVDDFGTGYSSLSHLRQLKIQNLKIDNSFVRDLEHDADDAAIVGAILHLAQNLRLRTIAEGIENSAQWDFLRTHGCDLAQGFFIAKPQPFDEFIAFLRKQH